MLAFKFMEMKIYIYNSGHKTKMAVMLVYGIIPLKPSSPKPEERLQGNLVCSIRDSSPSQFVQVITLVDLDLFFCQGQIWNLSFYIEKCDSDGFFGNYCSL